MMNFFSAEFPTSLTIIKYTLGSAINIPLEVDKRNQKDVYEGSEGTVLLYIRGLFYVRNEDNEFLKTNLSVEFVELNSSIFKKGTW